MFCSTDAAAASGDGDGSFIFTNCVKSQSYGQNI